MLDATEQNLFAPFLDSANWTTTTSARTHIRVHTGIRLLSRVKTGTYRVKLTIFYALPRSGMRGTYSFRLHMPSGGVFNTYHT